MSDNTFLASMGIDFSEEGASDLTALLAANSTWLAPPHPSAGPGYSSPAQQQQQPSNSCNNPFLHPEHQKAMTDLNIALTQVASLSVANSNLTTRAVTAEAKVMELARRLQHGEMAAVTTPGASRSSKQRTRPSPLPPYEPIDPTIRAKYQPDVDRLNRLPPSATSITEPYSAAGTVKLGGLYSALKEKPLSITAAQTKTMGESRCALVNDLLDIGRTWEQQNSEDVEFAIKVLEYRVVPLQYCPSTAEVEQASDSATAARTGSWMARLLLQKELENRRVGFTKRNEVPVKVKTEPGLENEAPSLKHPRSDTEDDSPPRQGPSSRVLGNHTAPVSIPTKILDPGHDLFAPPTFLQRPPLASLSQAPPSSQSRQPSAPSTSRSSSPSQPSSPSATASLVAPLLNPSTPQSTPSTTTTRPHGYSFELPGRSSISTTKQQRLALSAVAGDGESGVAGKKKSKAVSKKNPGGKVAPVPEYSQLKQYMDPPVLDLHELGADTLKWILKELMKTPVGLPNTKIAFVARIETWFKAGNNRHLVDSAPLPPPPSDGVAVADVVDGKVAAEEETALEETALEEMENEEPIDGGMMM